MKNLRKVGLILVSLMFAFISLFVLCNNQSNAESTELYDTYVTFDDGENWTTIYGSDYESINSVSFSFYVESYLVVDVYGDDGTIDGEEDDGTIVSKSTMGYNSYNLYPGSYNCWLVDYYDGSETVITISFTVEIAEPEPEEPEVTEEFGETYARADVVTDGDLETSYRWDPEDYPISEYGANFEVSQSITISENSYVYLLVDTDDGMFDGSNGEYTVWVEEEMSVDEGFYGYYEIELGEGEYTIVIVDDGDSDYWICRIYLTIEVEDTTAPTNTSTGGSSSWSTSATITASGTDNLALHATPYCFVTTNSSSGCSWTASATKSFTSNTNTTYYTFIRDAANNVSSSKSHIIKVDKTKPIWTTTNTSSLTSGNSVTVSLTDSGGSGIYNYSSTTYYQYGWSTSSSSGPTYLTTFTSKTSSKVSFVVTVPTVTKATTYYLWIYNAGKDNAGNVPTASGKSFYATVSSASSYVKYSYTVNPKLEVTINGTTYRSGETVKIIAASASLTSSSSLTVTNYNQTLQNTGTSLTVTEGIWDVTNGNQSLSLYVYQPTIIINDKYYKFTDGEDLNLPANMKIKFPQDCLYGTDSGIYYEPAGMIYNDDTDEEIEFIGIYKFNPYSVDISNAQGLIVAENTNYRIELEWSLGGVSMGIHYLYVYGKPEITAVVTKATLNSGKITFTNSDSESFVRKSYINAGGTVTYFIGKSDLYDSDLDSAFEKYGVTVSASEFFSSSLVTPQGLVGEVELYTKISATGLNTLYPRSGKINISNSGTSTTSFSLFVEDPIEQQALSANVVLTSDILNQNVNKYKHSNILLIAMLSVSVLLAIEIIVIKRNKAKKLIIK